MAKATASENKELLKGLEDLATQARNSEQGYKQSAESVQDADLRSIFSDLSRERGQQANELDQIIRRLGGTPPSPQGSAAGAAHRTWVNLKSAITGGDRQSILQEVFRGESHAEETYDRFLRTDLHGMMMPQDDIQTIQRQHGSVRAARDRFRSMIESMGGEVPAGGRMGGIASGMESYVVERPMMGTALAFGIGLVAGCLLTMSMRSTMSEGGRMDYGKGRRQAGYRYGTEGRTGYRYGTPAYGSSGQAGYGAGTQTYYGEGAEADRTTTPRT